MRVASIHHFARRGGVAIALGVIAACGSAGPVGRVGNLGNGTFQYQCLTDQDPACPEGQKTLQGCNVTPGITVPAGTQCFPSSVAVNGRFRLNYASDPSVQGVGNPVLKVVETARMAALGDGTLKGLKTGYVGVYSQSTVDSTLIDYTLIRVSPIAKVTIVDPATKIGVGPQETIAASQSKLYSLIAQDDSELPLAGAIESYVWETSDPTIVALGDNANSATMHLNAVKTGKATITAYADDSKAVKSQFDIMVP
jgi:hypothetical protein